MVLLILTVVMKYNDPCKFSYDFVCTGLTQSRRKQAGCESLFFFRWLTCLAVRCCTCYSGTSVSKRWTVVNKDFVLLTYVFIYSVNI